MADNDMNEVIVAAVALVVSVVALLATFMQVLQQYYASARGYSQCNEKVMGRWALTKSRRFSLEELRFEVQFDAPVIFVSPPHNKLGPIANAEIFYLDGTEKSLQETWTSKDMDLRKEYQEKTAKERIHTADNERASWVVLLYAIQRMEATSSEWQSKQYDLLGPPTHGLPTSAPSLHDTHTMTVALQRKRKSWDTMPSTITKPYATTTICHLIEMIAALGVYWKEFDRKHDRYRAEGNGFMVLGERVSELGLMFSFQVYGKCHFERNRVIPVDEVKELCFGHVPTIYRETLDRRRLEFPADEAQNLGSLQMSTRTEIAETLVMIGCNNNTVGYFREEGRRIAHLFPISFEILGMLGRTLHIENSNFTYIPNPTPDRWDKRAVSLPKVLESYQDLFLAESPRNPILVNTFSLLLKEILLYCGDTDPLQRLLLLRALHTTIDATDEILTARTKEERRALADGTPARPQVKKRDSEMTIDGVETTRQGARREMVQDVIRAQIQEVVRQLFDREDRSPDRQSLYVPQDGRAPSTSTAGLPDDSQFPRPPPPRFEDMNEASPDERQQKFMEVYFQVIRRRVVHHASKSTSGRRASITTNNGVPLPGVNAVSTAVAPHVGSAPAPPGFGFRRSNTGRTHVSFRNEDTTGMPAVPTGGLTNAAMNGLTSIDSDAEEDAEIAPRVAREIPLTDHAYTHDDIWCTLVLRMICWLMLHDINKHDVQVSKSELLGSRMPVYIA